MAAVVEQFHPHPRASGDAQLPGAALASWGQAEGEGELLSEEPAVVSGLEAHGALH